MNPGLGLNCSEEKNSLFVGTFGGTLDFVQPFSYYCDIIGLQIRTHTVFSCVSIGHIIAQYEIWKINLLKLACQFWKKKKKSCFLVKGFGTSARSFFGCIPVGLFRKTAKETIIYVFSSHKPHDQQPDVSTAANQWRRRQEVLRESWFLNLSDLVETQLMRNCVLEMKLQSGANL